jgi:hypothetical protein
LPTAEANDFILAFYNDIGEKLKGAFFYQNPAYYMSFEPKLDKIILFLSSCLATWLLVLQFRNRRDRLMKSKFLVLLLMFALYLALPTHLFRPELSIIDTRILIFIIFIGLLLLEVPKNRSMRSIVMFLVISLALAHIELIFVNYQSINQDFKEFYTAMKEIPSGKRVRFVTERKKSFYGRINPITYFGAYYFLEKGEGNVPDLTCCIGPLRALQTKNKQTQVKLKDVGNRNPYIEANIKIHRPSYWILFSKEKDKWLEELIEGYGYFKVVKLKDFKLYKKDKDRKQNIPRFGWKYDGFGSKNYDYLLLYSDAESTIGLKNDLELVFSRKYIRIYKRKENSYNDIY